MPPEKTRPSKTQLAEVKALLKEMRVELAGWDPHILAHYRDEVEKQEIIKRMDYLGWQFVPDPTNEADGLNFVEFSLD